MSWLLITGYGIWGIWGGYGDMEWGYGGDMGSHLD